MEEVLFPMMQSPDGVLVDLALQGDRIAFGCLYLRHHEAAWRLGSVAAGWGPDAEVAVIEGFTGAFGALGPGALDDAFRPALLTSVREAALARPRRRAVTDLAAEAAGCSTDSDAGELVLGDDHLVREAVGAVSEPARTALWLTEVEAMTPAEVGAMLELEPAAVLGWVEIARHDLRDFYLAAYQRQETPAACRFTVEHLVEYVEGRAPEADAGLVSRHLDQCPACRVRHGEVSNLPGTMLATLAPAPNLGGECQRHWLENRQTVLPARPSRLPAPLPPVPAAAPVEAHVPSRTPMPRPAPSPRSRQRWLPLVGAGVAGLALLLGALGAPAGISGGARTLLSATGSAPPADGADGLSETAAGASAEPSVRTEGRVSSRRHTPSARSTDERSTSLAAGASGASDDASSADPSDEGAPSGRTTLAGLAGIELSLADVAVGAAVSTPAPTLRPAPPPPPAPREPAPTVALPVDPVPTEPIFAEPIPAEPIPALPIPTEPIPTEPIPTEPIPTEPIPTDPVPPEPIPVDPVPTDPPAPSEPSPVPTKPGVDPIWAPPTISRPDPPAGHLSDRWFDRPGRRST